MKRGIMLIILLVAAQISCADMLRIQFPDLQGDNSGAIDVLNMDMILDDISGDYTITVTSSSDEPFNGACRLNANIWNPSDDDIFSHTFNDDCPIGDTFTLSGTSAQLTNWQAGDQVATSLGTVLGNSPSTSSFRSSVLDLINDTAVNCDQPFPNICDEDAKAAQEVFAVEQIGEQLDQENAPIWEGGSTNIQTSNEVGQSFQPSHQDLVSLDIDLIYQGGDGDVAAKILRNGAPVPNGTYLS